MLNIKLPKTRYKLAAGVAPNYPNLEERADGMLIPIAYGDLHNVIPVCIDTDTQLYKVAGHTIHAINEIRTETGILDPLAVPPDYITYLASGEFSIPSTPFLKSGVTYYFIIETSYAVHPANYLRIWQWDPPSVYAGGELFTITNAGVWTAQTGYDLRFLICGKADLSDPWHHQIDQRYSVYLGYVDVMPSYSFIGLKDDNARFWLAQSFTPTEDFYCTSICLFYMSPTPIRGQAFRVFILDAQVDPAIPGANLIGVKSEWDTIIKGGQGHNTFPLLTEKTGLVCDIEGAEKTGATIIDGADMIEDLVVNRLGKSSSILEPTALTNFKTKRMQTIAAYIDCDTTFGEIVGKLESSLLFKLVPLQDETYATIVYEADTVEVRPHFFDEHFLSFSMRHDFSAVRAIVKVKYDENPFNDEFKVAEGDSDVAKFVYGVEDTLEVETYLKQGTDAAILAADYLGMYETPPLEITFEIRGYGLDLIPGCDKVKITRTRAAYAGGAINGILFRIVKITKKPGTASTEIVAILDTQTY